jgi:hypothetical protein
LREKRGSGELTVEVVDDPFEVGFIEDLFAFGDAEQEGVAAEVVDLAGDAFGVVIDGGEETVAEELVGGTGNTQVVFDVSDGLLQVRRWASSRISRR